MTDLPPESDTLLRHRIDLILGDLVREVIAADRGRKRASTARRHCAKGLAVNQILQAVSDSRGEQ